MKIKHGKFVTYGESILGEYRGGDTIDLNKAIINDNWEEGVDRLTDKLINHIKSTTDLCDTFSCYENCEECARKELERLNDSTIGNIKR